MPLIATASLIAHVDGLLVRIKGNMFKVPWARIEPDFLAPLMVELDKARAHGLLPAPTGDIEAAVRSYRNTLPQHAGQPPTAATDAAASASRYAPPATGNTAPPATGNTAPTSPPVVHSNPESGTQGNTVTPAGTPQAPGPRPQGRPSKPGTIR